MWPWVFGVLVVAAPLAGLVVWRRMHCFGSEVKIERARELFRLQRERLEAIFLKAAAATGKPRGLRWKDCQWEDGVEFVRDRKTGHIAALVAVTVQFEAVEGSDMEGLPAVKNLRNGSAVFFFQKGHWLTAGKVVFNMNPDEAIAHFGKQYERIGP
jgi:hypothetical protein